MSSSKELIDIIKELENAHINKEDIKSIKIKWKNLFPERAFQNIIIKLK